MALRQNLVPVWGEVDSVTLVPRVFMNRHRLHKIKVWKTRFDLLCSIHRGRRVWRVCGHEDKCSCPGKIGSLEQGMECMRMKRRTIAAFECSFLRRRSDESRTNERRKDKRCYQANAPFHGWNLVRTTIVPSCLSLSKTGPT